MKLVHTSKGYIFIKNPMRALSNSYISTKINLKTNKNNENNIKNCIKMSLVSTLDFIPLFNKLNKEIIVDEINQEFFQKWLDKKAANDNDYRFIRNNLNNDDTTTKFIEENNLSIEVERWFSRVYGVTYSTPQQAFVDALYTYTPYEYTYEIENLEVDISTICTRIDEYFLKLKSKETNIFLEVQNNKYVQFKIKGKVRIYVDNEIILSPEEQIFENIVTKIYPPLYRIIVDQEKRNMTGIINQFNRVHHTLF